MDYFASKSSKLPTAEGSPQTTD